MIDAAALSRRVVSCSKWSLRIALAAAGVLGTARHAAAEPAAACVGLKDRPVQALGAIVLATEALPPWLRTAAARAAALWNHPECNATGGFPRIVFAAVREPHRVIRVRWEPGFNIAQPRSCGSFVGAEIVLYGHAIDPRTRELGGCGDSDRIAETLAHEIGHALGLTDRYEPDCYGSIMSQLVWAGESSLLPRTVQPFECAAADSSFETPAERRWLGRRATTLASAEPRAESPAFVADGSELTLPERSAELRPRSARTAPGILATASVEFHP